MRVLLLFPSVLYVFFVFVAGEFHQLGVGLEVHDFGGGPGFGVGFGVVDGGLDFEVAEVAAVDAFGYVEGCLVVGWPAWSSQVLPLKPVVSTTSVSPSHLPVE